jgi:coenzyme F420-reducing hydrogenase alpha subunit
MKKACNEVCEVLVGRHVHPISATVGGFTKLPVEKDLDAMLTMLNGMKPDMDATVELISSLKFPEFERDTEYVALVSDDGEYPLLSGEVGSTEGVRVHKKAYERVANEFVVPHSSAKHTRLTRESYAVGALARFNLNYDKLLPRARDVASLMAMKPKCINPYLNTAAQLIESVHCLDDAIAIVEGLREKGIDHDELILVALNEQSRIPVQAGNGVGAVEVPRGILFHNYEADGKGTIVNANCVIPTNQNLNNIEHDMKELVPELLAQNKSDEEITLALEMLVRAYDPCISCSTHFLDVRFVNR